ncbi:MAG TPA: hypothetical protein VID25_02190 [Candidatus Limnocylindrales bacterium]|jgi:hypothetical protein
MAELSRRRFIAGTALSVAAGAAAASGIGAAAAVPQLLAGVGRATPADAPDLTPLGIDVVAHLRDASTGEVSVMVGDREIVYQDAQLASRLLQGARRATQEG